MLGLLKWYSYFLIYGCLLVLVIMIPSSMMDLIDEDLRSVDCSGGGSRYALPAGPLPDVYIEEILYIEDVSAVLGEPVGFLKVTVPPEVRSNLVTDRGALAPTDDITSLGVEFTAVGADVPIGELILSASSRARTSARSFDLQDLVVEWASRPYPLDSYRLEFAWSIPLDEGMFFKTSHGTLSTEIPVLLTVSCSPDKFDLRVSESSLRGFEQRWIELQLQRDIETIVYVIAVTLAIVIVGLATRRMVGQPGQEHSTLVDAITIVLTTITVVTLRSVLVPADLPLPTSVDLVMLLAVALSLNAVAIRRSHETARRRVS